MRRKKEQLAKELFEREGKTIVFYKAGNFIEANRIVIYDGKAYFEIPIGYPTWNKYKKYYDKQIKTKHNFLISFLEEADYITLDNKTRKEIENIKLKEQKKEA